MYAERPIKLAAVFWTQQAHTGAGRRTLAKNGGWPAFLGEGDSTRVVFHRKGSDGW